MTDKKFQAQFIAFLQQKGFVWGPEPEIYGGLAGFYTYAPMGKRVKNSVEDIIRDVFRRYGFWEVECPIVSPAVVWKASGHLEGFTDPLIECSKCKASYNAAKLVEEKTGKSADKMRDDELLEFITNNLKCHACGSKFRNEITRHNLMMKTSVGRGREAYNRPETATMTYLPFQRFYDLFRKKLPFSVFQIGKAFRNEISPRQHVIRGREFTQAEGQTFVTPGQKRDWPLFDKVKKEKLSLWTADAQAKGKKPESMTVEQAVKKKVLKNKAFAWSMAVTNILFREMGFPSAKVRFRQHNKDEKAFYSDDTWDLEVETRSFGWVEVCGTSDRTDYDLKQHEKESGKSMQVEGADGKKVAPHVLEIAFGTDRPTLALLDSFYVKEGDRTILKLPAQLAPIQAAVFPLLRNKPELVKKADEVNALLAEKFYTFIDYTGSIGRRYARQDEKGTPLGVTIDFDTLEDDTVTVRDRDTTKQVRVKISELEDAVSALLAGEKKLSDFGKFIN